ncbi:MAG: cytochrome c [Luteolibacter sp.]
MNHPFLFIAAIITCASMVHSEPSENAAAPDPAGHLLTYSNRPLGSPNEPLLLRTFMPDPGLGEDVLIHHHRAYNSPKYNLKAGKDMKGEFEPIDGLPSSIGVNYGSALSYCWDTVECRVLYAWDNGFLDMESYWGDPQRGNRQSFGYVPHLVGTLFHKATDKDPLLINGKSVSDSADPPKFLGYQKIGSRFVFKFRAGGAEVSCEVSKGDAEHSLVIRYQTEGETVLNYRDKSVGHVAKKVSESEILVTIQGSKIADYNGNPEKDLLAGGVNQTSGKRIFNAMACGTCHSLDGSKGHGPSLLGLHGKKRKINGSDEPIVVDDAYILESIQNPNAKVAAGYPENYMPPYQLKDDEYKALLIYLKSITQPHE